MHGASYLSDAQGAASIGIRDSDQLLRYRFGENSSDFLICKRCGIYVAAIIEEQGRCWSALNLRLTNYRDLEAPQVRRWRDQSRRERIEFRKAVWAPTVMNLHD